MPRVQVAPKKEYTSEGRHIGKLRIAFCGDSCSGKTTLLRTIADHSPDIVYCEDTLGSEPGRPTTEINEVRASSQPYPTWRILSTAPNDCSDAVMERNICLVDTPGYALSADANDAIYPILRYLEAQFERVNDLLRDDIQLNEEDFLNLIASPQGGLTQVDCAVYCITQPLTDTDVKFIHDLTLFTTVIPIISKADASSSESLALKSSIRAQLDAIHFPFFDPD
ncbi:protein of unknown function [Taphrina deformans PYCC 5710]|uniref:Septin-type G domain-containing protein n=1 Tax=Taphrina deformans (strain PYCC 5710 / ATCC 11124 / CBS 356.35 / IMI 108563 / JCM 9778 / NBRC 8474) TaxID=1097556 RepID=R4XK41_TAPDE|nr:protein of unknown function [Taphrina deformans PYCC 5710]|eukprot:CCG84818.1 protein of unknown function [Taphrina deformans PYCC 5710]